MLYYVLTVKDKEYKCRLNAKACVQIEKKLGTNPLNVLAKVANTNELPDLETLIIILHGSLQAVDHSISMDDAYQIYDDYIEEGHTLVEFIAEIVNIFKESGFFKEQEEKN